MSKTCTRAPLLRLAITADLCPQPTPRILGLIAQRSIIPVSIIQVQRPRSLALEIILAPPDRQQGEILCAKIAELVGVRQVRRLRPPPAP